VTGPSNGAEGAVLVPVLLPLGLDLGGDEAKQVELPISKSQLASKLGTVSETLSRTFRKLTDDDLIIVRGKAIELLDRDRLEDLSFSFKE